MLATGMARPPALAQQLGPAFAYAPGQPTAQAAFGFGSPFGVSQMLTPEQVTLGQAGREAAQDSITLRAVTGAPRNMPAYESYRRPEPVVRSGDVMAAGMTRPVLAPVPPRPAAITPVRQATVTRTTGTGMPYKAPAPKTPAPARRGDPVSRPSAIKPIAKPPVRAPESKTTKPLPKPVSKPPAPVYSKANALPGTRF
jgi:hypothetical protein